MRPQQSSLTTPVVTITQIAEVSVPGDPAEGLDVPVSGESRLWVRATVANMDPNHFLMARFFEAEQMGFPALQAGTLFFRQGSTDQYWGWVPLARLSLTLGTAPNNYLYAGVQSILTAPEDPLAYTRVRVAAHLNSSPQTAFEVDARNSVWFAYALPNFSARTGDVGEVTEREIANSNGKSIYRPAMAVVPQGATQVQVTVAPGNMWRHDPSSAYDSGPEGRDTNTPLTNYAAYYLGHAGGKVADTSLKHNTLIYLHDNGGATPYTPIPLPVGATTIACSAGQKIYFAMHDSWQWNNNSGTQQLTLQWS